MNKENQLNELSYQIIGVCMEIHNILGKGLLEVVYKDALEFEFRQLGIPFEREKKYSILYKGHTLPHYYFADFVVFDKIILEIKAQNKILEGHYACVIHYLAISDCPLGLIINFNSPSLITKRVVL